MALANFVAIRKAVRERLAGTIATPPRQVTAGRFGGEWYERLEDHAKRLRALTRPRYDVQVRRIPRGRSSPAEPGNVALYDIEVRLVCGYALKHPALNDDKRDEIRALAEQDADVIRQALGWGNVLLQTSGGTPTGLVSGRLRFDAYAVLREEFGTGGAKEGAGLFETEILLTGRVLVTMATS